MLKNPTTAYMRVLWFLSWCLKWVAKIKALTNKWVKP